MYRALLLVVILMVFAITPTLSQDKASYFDFNKDRFLAGPTVVQDKEGVDDLFMAGETVKSNQDITGSAHLAGRKVISIGAIGGDAYVAGIEVSLEGDITGDLTVSGYNLHIGNVDGDLRASGGNLTLSGPVSGYALVAGDDVTFESVIKGDVSLAAQEVDFANASRIEGNLTLYEKEIGKTEIPARVISEDRVERRELSEWSEVSKDLEKKSLSRKVFGFFKRVLLFIVLAVSIAVGRPQKLEDLRQNILGHPLRNFLFGFLAMSAGIGATILLMFSRLGFLLAVSSLLIALLGAFTGYVVGTYAIGVRLLPMVKRPEPDTIGSRTIAAAIGAFAVSIVALIPYLGGLFTLIVALIGAGALFVRLLRPKFSAAA